MVDPAVRFPPPATLQWVATAAGGIRVVGGRRMIGGITSSVHRLTVVNRSGSRRHVVLRRWIYQDVARGQRRAKREGQVLDALSRRVFPAPRLVGVSEGAETDGVPAVLMTRVPGHVLLTPRNPDAWMGQIAEVLPRLHGLDVSAEDQEPEAQREAFPAPDWVTRTAIWDAAQRVLVCPPPRRPASEGCFIHNDFQLYNLLWQRERLTGVVDWTRPGVGSPDLDVAHCRLNLAVLYSVDWAERFRLAYEATAGRKVEPWFDLLRITRFTSDWQRFIPVQTGGRIAVDVVGMPTRVEELIATVLKRI